MLGRDYLSRQAQTLLKMARVARDPQTAAKLTVKASDLQERLDETPAADRSPTPPDVQQDRA
jgi:hypothetical protein